LKRGELGGALQLHGTEEGGRRPWRGGGAAGSVREEGEGGARLGGPARPAWLLGVKKAGWAGWPLGLLGRKLKKIHFRIKIEFLNIPRLWKFA
jgi:hypothetical protein